MIPVRNMMNKFSQGRRTSVGPIRLSTNESCQTNTAIIQHQSGIPTLVRSVSTGKKRSISCDRNRAVKSAIKVVDHNNEYAGLLFTPQNAVTPKRPLSARAANECITQLSSKRNSTKKDHRPVSDKTLQIEFARHVCSYLNRTGLVGDLLVGGQSTAPSTAIQPSVLKNMNKNTFIILFNLLYTELGARVKLDMNSSGFQERIPTIAKKLGYHGVINKSHLLTPSSPHSWPYVIAFLAWIVDLVEMVGTYENIVKEETNIPLVFMRFHLCAYNAYNKMEITDTLPCEYVENFKEKLFAIRNIEPKVMETIRETRDKHRAKLDSEIGILKEMEEDVLKIENQSMDLTKSIEDTAIYLKEWDDNKAAITQEINKCEEKKISLAFKLEELRKEKESILITCSQQKMSKMEWNILASEVKELKEEVDMIFESINNLNNTISKTDLQISSKRNKLSKLWIQFMNTTIPMQSHTKSTQKFLDEVGKFNPMYPDAMQCFKQIEDSLQCALSEINEKLTRNEAQAKALQDETHKLSLEVKDLQKKHEHLKFLCKEKIIAIQSAKDSFEKEKEELIKHANTVKLETKRIQEITNDHEAEYELEKLKEMEKIKCEELELLKIKAVTYFKNKEKMIVQYKNIVQEKLKSFYTEAEAILKELNNL